MDTQPNFYRDFRFISTRSFVFGDVLNSLNNYCHNIMSCCSLSFFLSLWWRCISLSVFRNSGLWFSYRFVHIFHTFSFNTLDDYCFREGFILTSHLYMIMTPWYFSQLFLLIYCMILLHVDLLMWKCMLVLNLCVWLWFCCSK